MRDPSSQQSGPSFTWRHSILYHHEGEHNQLVVPQALLARLMYLAHDFPLAGYQAMERALARLAQQFYWPGIQAQVAKYCAECQLMRPPPFQPMPIAAAPFERIGADLVGPVTPSSGRHRYILVVTDYTTRYPEAKPLRDTTAKAVAQ